MQSNNKINVYDFDGTIYNGDSAVDFFLFALQKRKKNILLFPKIFLYMVLYLFHFIKKEKFKTVYFSFLRYFDDPEALVDEFWQTHEKKIYPELKKLLANDQQAVILSASPNFLIEPIGHKLGVKTVIASTASIKTGEWLDDNCRGENKLEYLKKNYKKFSINNSYSDSYTDRFIASASNNAYMVSNGEILAYDVNKLYHDRVKKTGTCLGIIFFIIYFVLDMLINYNHDLTSNWDFLFQSDTGRVYNDFSTIIYDHNSRIGVHPLIILFQPLILLLQGFTHNGVFALGLFMSLIGGLCIKYLYQSLCLISQNKIVNFVLTLIYGFSFSSLVFNTTFEIYSLSALSFILLWYNIFLDFNHYRTFKLYRYIALGILTAGILLTNYTVFGVGTLVLWLGKKVNFKKFITIHLLTILAIIVLTIVQELIWITPKNIVRGVMDNSQAAEGEYVSYDITLAKAQNVYNDIYMNGIAASKIKETYYDENNPDSKTILGFVKPNYIKTIIITLFYGLLICLIIINFKHNKILNLGLLVSLLGMSFLHILYGNDNAFLYSENIIYLVILLFALNNRRQYKITSIFLIFFFLFELFSNVIGFKQLLVALNKHFKMEFISSHLAIIKELIIFIPFIIAIIVLIFSAGLLIKKYIRHHKTILLIVGCLCIFITSILFIRFETFNNYRASNNIYGKLSIPSPSKSLSAYYEDEVEAYQKYKDQYKAFVGEKNIVINKRFNNEKFLLYGMGNRDKYIYQNGVLRDIATEKVYRRFDVLEQLIIPNLYTVLIKTKDNKFYKIVEDEKAVHIISDNDDDIVPNTEEDISLPRFDDYKYSELLNVLYQEILINIKDGIIYPNVFTYDKPQYKDAAVAAMVLKKTDNIDIIKDWILSIDDIYDTKDKDVTNLGELLYLLSLVTDKDNDMVKKIIKEADTIKVEDKLGKYLTNSKAIDYPDYQTLWLKFGLSQFNLDLAYDYKKTDNHTNAFWYTDENVSKLRVIVFNDNDPSLAYEQRHLLGDKASMTLSNQLYPLSWKKADTRADYAKLTFLGTYFIKNKIEPTNVLSAAELFLLITA